MKKAIKMIVTDLDNTLLRHDKTVSDYTVTVFKRLRERGGIGDVCDGAVFSDG